MDYIAQTSLSKQAKLKHHLPFPYCTFNCTKVNTEKQGLYICWASMAPCGKEGLEESGI